MSSEGIRTSWRPRGSWTRPLGSSAGFASAESGERPWLGEALGFSGWGLGGCLLGWRAMKGEGISLMENGRAATIGVNCKVFDGLQVYLRGCSY